MTGKELVDEFLIRALDFERERYPTPPDAERRDRLSDAIAALIDAAILHQAVSSHKESPLGKALARCEAEMKK